MREIASIVIKDNKVVQSFGYKDYLPLGSLNATVENLSNWQVGEIFIKNIPTSTFDIETTSSLLRKSIKDYPVIYAGGIQSLRDIEILLQSGVDRFGFDSSLSVNCSEKRLLHSKIRNVVGRQAMVAHLNVKIYCGKMFSWNYQSKRLGCEIDEKYILQLADNFSEIIFNDFEADGERISFDQNILTKISKFTPLETDLLISGGVSPKFVFNNFELQNYISGVIYGNSLYRQENAHLFK